MAEYIELDIFLTKGNISLQEFFSLLENEGLSVSIEEMITFDDWQYTHQITVDLVTFDFNRNDILLKTFTLIRFIVNTVWRCVLITSFEDTYLNLSFGLDSSDLLSSDQADNSSQIAFFYDLMADKIDETITKQPWNEMFLAASMGVEYSVQFYRAILPMLQDNNGVARWVLPKTVAKNIYVENFQRKEKSNTIVFSQKKNGFK